MKATELRIGNYYQYAGDYGITYAQIQEIKHNQFGLLGDFDGTNFEICKPILLTEEWLLKFGFVSSIPYECFTKWTFHNNKSRIKGWVLIFFNGKICRRYLGKENSIYWNKIKVQYVNQLQNLYYALTGEELTIKNTLND
jgi:hypothetical protein